MPLSILCLESACKLALFVSNMTASATPSCEEAHDQLRLSIGRVEFTLLHEGTPDLL